MLLVFEVHLAPGSDGAEILSEEALASTNAQVMTLEEAAAVGFSGFQPNVEGAASVRLIAVAARDRGFITSALDRSHEVTGFRVHEVDT